MGEEGIRVRCCDCAFEKTVGPDDEEMPADILIEHGQRTGHTLALDRLNDPGEDDPGEDDG